jgi:hypothetical protein
MRLRSYYLTLCHPPRDDDVALRVYFVQAIALSADITGNFENDVTFPLKQPTITSNDVVRVSSQHPANPPPHRLSVCLMLPMSLCTWGGGRQLDMIDTLALNLEASLNNNKQKIQAAGLSLMAYTGAIGARAPKFFHRCGHWAAVGLHSLHPTCFWKCIVVDLFPA